QSESSARHSGLHRGDDCGSALLSSSLTRAKDRHQGSTEPLPVFPSKNLGGVGVADRLLLSVLGLFGSLALQGIDELLVYDPADRESVLGLMRFAGRDFAVAGIGGGMDALLQRKDELREIVVLAIAQVLSPMLAEVGKLGGCLFELLVAFQ